MIDVLSGIPGARTMITELFKGPIDNFLHFGLGKNGTTAEEFYYAVQFLFKVRSDKPETWADSRYMRDVYVDENTGKRTTRVQTLTDEQLVCMTADYLWNLMEMPITLDEFTTALLAQRKEILNTNRRQIAEFLAMLNKSSLARTIVRGETIPIKFLEQPVDDILTDPIDDDVLAELISYRPAPYRAKIGTHCRHRRRRKTPTVNVERLNQADQVVFELKPLTPSKGGLFGLESIAPEPADNSHRRSCGMSA